jgi:hypothetical protein
MLATGNNSLHGLLSIDNSAGTAGSMRVVEILFKSHRIHQKPEADAYWHTLKHNYGHVGEVFMRHIMQHRDAVAQRVRDKMAAVDQAAGIQSGERFWSATIAAVIVAGEVARDLGLLLYDPSVLETWALETQIPFMRGVVVEEYTNPIGLLAQYLEHINGNILYTDKAAGSNGTVYAVRAPSGQMLAHYALNEKTMWVLKSGFKDYCTRIGANATKITSELHQPRFDNGGTLIRVVSNTNQKKVLGAGTDYAKAQSYCFVLNMAHPDITGTVDLQVSNNAPTAPAKRRNLRVG